MALKVVVTDYGFPNLDSEREVLAGIGAELHAYQCTTEQETLEAVQDADAILTQWAPLTANVIASLQKCKLIVRYGIGVDNVDLEAAGRRGLPVANIPDYALDEVADHTFALLLTSARKIPQVMNAVRNGEWSTNPAQPMYSLAGRTLGLAGFGNIARKVAQRAQPFGLQVIAYDPYVASEVYQAHGVVPATFEELLQQSDYLSVHLPLNEATHRLLDREAFALMKPGAYIINTSRGGVIHTEHLIEALQSGRLAGVGLDVLESEPIEADSPLLSLPEVVLTSHCAWYTEDALRRLQLMAAQEVERGLAGLQPRHIANRQWLNAALPYGEGGRNE